MACHPSHLAGCSKSPPASFSPRKHPQRSREATPPVLSSAAALLDDLFEQPAAPLTSFRSAADCFLKKSKIFWRNRHLRDTMQRSHRQLSPIGLATDDLRDRHRDAPVPACRPCGPTLPSPAICRDAHDRLSSRTRAATSS